jgi:hypothetical protein
MRLTFQAAVAIAFLLAPVLFFGLGAFLNWAIPA